MSQAQISQEAPLEDAVWGAFSPQTWYAGNPNLISSVYMLPVEDTNLASGHDLTWFQQNHPDWIMYACDSSGNPTPWVPRASGFPDVPLDFSNPAVIQYQVSTLASYMVANHLNTIAADNLTFVNYLEAPNAVVQGNDPSYPSNEHPGTDGWYGCGHWDVNHQTFTKRYTTGYDKSDPQFEADLVNWVEQVHHILTTDPTIAPLHFKLIVNHPLGNVSNPDELAVVQNVDGMLDEDGFSGYDHYNVSVPGTVQYMQFAQSHNVAFWIVNYFCMLANGVQNCEQSLTQQQLDYAMATYQLGNEGGAGFFNSPSTGEIYSYHQEYQANVGNPCGEYTSPAPSLYERKFANALVLVNASNSSAQTVTLPSTHAYTDATGRMISTQLTLNPDDGYVLLTTNGCT